MILYNGKEILFGQFPNGEINLKKFDYRTNLDADSPAHTITLKYESDADLFKLALVKEYFSTLPVTLRITYVPYSRMDRDSDTYAFSLRTFTNFINWMEWDEVVIYEPHSDVLPALLDVVRVVDVSSSFRMQEAIASTLGSNYQVFFPDAGAQKRYADDFESRPYLVGFKHRDFVTGKLTDSQVVGERKSDNVAIVDDLCSRGGTFVLAAEKLRAMGFKRIILAVAHCENTIFLGKIFTDGLIEKVITTDSILYPNGSPKLQIIPLTAWD